MDIILITQQIIYLYSGKPYIERIDGQLCHIIIIYARAIYKVTPIRIIAAYGINLLPCILLHLCHLGKRFLAPEC